MTHECRATLRRDALRTLAAGAAAALLVACASTATPATEPATPDTVTSPTSQPEPTESASAEPTDSSSSSETLTNTLVDEDGYRTKIEVTNMTIQTETDIEDQKPGLAKISIEMQAEGTFTNLTSGHSASIGQVQVLPAWRANSIVCTDATRKASSQAWRSVEVAGKDVWHTETDKFCAIEGMVRTDMNAGKIAPEASRTLDLMTYRAVEPIVPEKSLIKLDQAFQQPDFWILLRPTGGFRSNGKAGTCWSDVVFSVVDVTSGGKGMCVLVDTDR